MNRKLFRFISLIAMLALVLTTGGHALASPSAASALTLYYNLMSYEGIGTVGHNQFGVAPSVGDAGDYHCRYINITPTAIGDYYLRYPLHLPNGATITKVSVFVADNNDTGVLWAYLRSRPWQSNSSGTTKGIGVTGNHMGDSTLDMTPLSVVVNNQTSEYEVDVTPANNNGNPPDQLCVYGLQVTYTVNGAFLPLIQKGG